MFARYCVPPNTLNIDADDVLSDLRHLCPAHTVFQDPSNSGAAVKEPNCACGIDPEFVSPASTKEQLNMIPGPRENKYGEDNMHNEKNLVALLSEPQARDTDHDHTCNSGHDTPYPVRFFLFCIHAALSFV